MTVRVEVIEVLKIENHELLRVTLQEDVEFLEGFADLLAVQSVNEVKSAVIAV